MTTIYKSSDGEAKVLSLYDNALANLGLEFEETTVNTRFCDTHIIITEPKEAPPLVILQGGNTVSPVTLSWFLPLTTESSLQARNKNATINR
ncbi:hypothetical protein C5S53_05935 [Methanophagales archaeon]|nr:hypothetical protein C5S53_05935 [Methanophagales archaeon]